MLTPPLLASREGVEPPLPVLETGVLPLNDRLKCAWLPCGGESDPGAAGGEDHQQVRQHPLQAQSGPGRPSVQVHSPCARSPWGFHPLPGYPQAPVARVLYHTGLPSSYLARWGSASRTSDGELCPYVTPLGGQTKVDPSRFELLTSALSAQRSTGLSYGSISGTPTTPFVPACASSWAHRAGGFSTHGGCANRVGGT